MHKVSWDSTVRTATCYGLHGLGIEYWWGQDFPWLSRPVPRLSQPPVQWSWVLPGSNSARAWCWPHTPSNTTVANGLELHLCLYSMPAQAHNRVIFTFRWKQCLLKTKTSPQSIDFDTVHYLVFWADNSLSENWSHWPRMQTQEYNHLVESNRSSCSLLMWSTWTIPTFTKFINIHLY